MHQCDRIAFYDNLKFILILLVVFGHVLGCNLDGGYITGIYLFIYAFHMPLFVFIMGFFSKRLEDENGNFRLNKVISYVLLYLGFKVLLFIFMRFILHQDIAFYLFTEHDAPWYLLACALWLSITYLVRNVKSKYMFVFSILFALIIGYDYYVEDVFALSRVIVFFPFFLFGYYLSDKRLNMFVNVLHKRKNQVLSFLFLVILLITFICFAENLDFLRPFVLVSYSYGFTIPFIDNVYFVLIRLFCMCLAFLMMWAVISLVPRRKMFFSKIGRRTLQIYILHLFFVYLVFYTRIEGYLTNFFGNIWPFVLFVLPILLTFLLSFRFLGKPFNKIMGLEYKKIFNNLK